MKVVAGVILSRRSRQKFLIARRNPEKHLGGKWEFPGGKVINGETDQEALKRELLEELNIQVEVHDFIGVSNYKYDKYEVNLSCYYVTICEGKIQLKDHSSYKWVTKEQMHNIYMTNADIPIIPRIDEFYWFELKRKQKIKMLEKSSKELIFLEKFIEVFYKKSEVFIRSSVNEFGRINDVLRNVFKNYFYNNVFSEEDILKAFESNGYKIKGTTGIDYTWDRFHSGSVLASENTFINIIPQCNKDLRLALKKGYPSNVGQETLNRLNLLKEQLEAFWIENKTLFD